MNNYQLLKLDQIMIGSSNPRKEFDENAISELSESIKQHGVLQPIIVRRHPTLFKEEIDTARMYELVCGERRYRASNLAEKETIPSIIRNLSDDEAFELQIIENLERKDVHPLQEADAFKKMLNSGKYSVADIAAKVAKTETFIAQRLKLNDLIPEIQKDFYNGDLGVGHAVLLARLSQEDQKEYHKQEIESGWSDGYGTVTELKEDLNRSEWNLDDACFDINDAELVSEVGACTNCLNCSLANPVLFPDIEENNCYNRSCFNKKHDAFILKELKEILEFKQLKEPDLRIVKDYGNGISKEIVEFVNENKVIVLEQYDDFNYASESEIKGFNLSTGKYIKIKVFSNNSDKSNGNQPLEEDLIKSQIHKIEERAARAIELDREKIQKRIIEELFEDKSLLNSETLTGEEITSFVYTLWEKGTYEYQQYLRENHNFPEGCYNGFKTFNHIKENFSSDNLSLIFRAFILFNLRSLTHLDYGKSGDPAALHNYIKFHKEREVELFTEEQNEKAAKRIERSDKKLAELQEQLQILGRVNRKSQDIKVNEITSINKSEPIKEWEKVPKRYALNNSYFKNKLNTAPDSILEIAQYLEQHGELPFDYDHNQDNWVYDSYVEKQKRNGVYHDQYFTPEETANEITSLAHNWFDNEQPVLDACCGFGMLSKPLLENGFNVEGFDLSTDLVNLYSHFLSEKGAECFQFNYLEETLEKQYFNIVSNPPYDVKKLTSFLEFLHSILMDNGTAILLIPKGFIEKERPKKLVEVISKFNVIHREDMQEDFARTKIKAEIVVLEKA